MDKSVTGSWKGLPFKGQPYLIKEDDGPDRQPQMQQDVFVRVFDTGDPKDMDEYQAVWKRVTKGEAIMSREDLQYNAASGHWRAFMRWMEMYYVPPAEDKGVC